MKLLNVGRNYKTVKGDKKGEYLTGILYLAPGNTSGYEVCPHRSPGCSAACLFTAGRGQLGAVKRGRIRKTKLFFENRNTFWKQLIGDIKALERKARRMGMKPMVRLNGTSDLPWERIPVKIDGKTIAKSIIEMFPHIAFYDYTKNPDRRNLAPNYRITFSLSEINEADARKQFRYGHNVAVVFAELPPIFWGKRVVNGDADDLRFIDPENVIVGLNAKGKGKKDTTGFVR